MSDLSDLRTVAETSQYARTARYADVVAFLDALDAGSPRVARFSFGTSFEGRDLPGVWITQGPAPTAASIVKSSKPLVLLFGNIHAGEVCGKEALCMLARELAAGDALLASLDIAIVPIYNADGNERMAAGNRPGQDGPEQMGTRANAQDLDLNRDWTKAEAPETRAFLAFLNQFDPELIVDTHTTNGSLHRYTLTYQGPKHPAGDAQLIAYGRDRFLPAVGQRLRAATGYESFFYGNFEGDHTRWEGYPAQPRYGAVYRGLRNRLTILSEAYSYAPFRDRVLCTLGFCRAVLEEAAEKADEIQQLVATADRRTQASSDPIPVRVELMPFQAPVVIAGFEEIPAPESDHPLGLRAGAALDRTVEHWNLFEPSVTVERPTAYLLSPAASAIAKHLSLHGIATEPSSSGPRQAIALVVTDLTRAATPNQAHERIESIDIEALPVELECDSEWTLVRMDQKLGSLAAILLEPQSEDGLLAWNFLEQWCKPGCTLPIYRLL